MAKLKIEGRSYNLPSTDMGLISNPTSSKRVKLQLETSQGKPTDLTHEVTISQIAAGVQAQFLAIAKERESHLPLQLFSISAAQFVGLYELAISLWPEGESEPNKIAAFLGSLVITLISTGILYNFLYSRASREAFKELEKQTAVEPDILARLLRN